MQVNPQFADYLRDSPSLTYVQASDHFVRRQLIDKLEIALGRKKIESVYQDLKARDFPVQRFFAEAIKASGVEVVHHGLKPNEISVRLIIRLELSTVWCCAISQLNLEKIYAF